MEHKQKFNKIEDYWEYMRARIASDNMQSILRGAVDVSDLQDQALIEMVAIVSVRSAEALIKALQVGEKPAVVVEPSQSDLAEQCSAYMYMGSSLLSEKEYIDAKKSFEKALSLNPSKSQALKLKELIDRCDAKINSSTGSEFTTVFPKLL